MSDPDRDSGPVRPFVGDERGVSEVLGAVLVFGLLVSVLVLFQTVAIPDANEEIEFKHSERVNDDIRLLRNAVLGAADHEERRAADIELGTQYPTRMVFLNPPSPSGTLQTGDSNTISASEFSVSNVCDVDETRSVTYRSQYSEYENAPTLVYENTVVYREFGDERIIDSGQAVVSGNRITLRPLVGTLSESGTDTRTVDFVGNSTGGTVVTDDLDITIPSELGDEEWETNPKLLGGYPGLDTSEDGGVTDNNDGTVTIHLKDPSTVSEIEGGAYLVRCSPVGINHNPGVNPDSPDSSESGDTGETNPTGDEAVELTEVSFTEGTETVTIRLENNREAEVTVTEARIPFYDAGENRRMQMFNDYGQLESNPDDELVIGESYESVDSSIEIPPNQERPIDVSFGDTQGDAGGGDFFILVFKYDTAPKHTYYIAIPGQQGQDN